MGAAKKEKAKAVKKDKKPIKRRLKTLGDARRFLADITNQLNRDDIDPNKAAKLGYLLQILAKIIMGDELEKRVLVLEATLKNQGGDR
jgi:hypothetical protein